LELWETMRFVAGRLVAFEPAVDDEQQKAAA
jgi:hypothetical protein